MARSANYMVNLGANAQGLVAGVRVATRSLASMEYVAGRTSKKLGALSPLFESAGYLSGMSLIAGASAALSARRMYEGIIYPAIKSAIELDVELRELYYLAGTNAGSEFAKGIKSKMQAQAIKSVLDFPSVVQGMSEIIKGGVRQGDAMEMADSLTNLVEASFGKMKVDDAGKMIALLNLKFKRPDDQSVKAWSDYLTDMAVMGAQQTHLDLPDIFSMMGAMSAAPQIAGETSPQQFFAVLQMLAQAGKRARMSGMQLNSFVNDMLNATNTLSESGSPARIEAMEALTLSYEDLFTVGKDGQKALKSIPSFLKTIMAARDTMIAKEGEDGHIKWSAHVDKMMGTNVSTMMLQLAHSAEVITEDGIKHTGIAAINEMERVYEKSRGITEKAAKAYRESWRGQIEIASGAWKTFFALLGEDMLKQLASVMTLATGLIQKIVKFATEYPVFVKVLSALIGGAFALNVAVTIVASTMAGLMLMTIFLIPGFVQMGTSLWGMAAAATSHLKKMKQQLGVSKDQLKIAIAQKKEELEILKIERAQIRARTISKRLKGEELNAAILEKATDTLGKTAEMGVVRGQLATLSGSLAAAGGAVSGAVLIGGAAVLGLAIYAMAAAAGLLFVAFLGLGRLIVKGGKSGLVGAFDLLVAKGKAALDTLLGLYTYLTTGKWNSAMQDRLQQSGGAAWMDNIIKWWARLKLLWQGITEGVDWSFFDSVLAKAVKLLTGLFGGAMDSNMNDTKESWLSIGRALGGMVNIILFLSGVFLLFVVGTLKLLLALAGAVLWVADAVGLFSGKLNAVQVGLIVVGAGLMLVTGAMLVFAIAAAHILVILALVGLAFMLMSAIALSVCVVILSVPLLIMAAFLYAGNWIIQNWGKVTTFLKDSMLDAYDFIVGLFDKLTNNPLIQAPINMVSHVMGKLLSDARKPGGMESGNQPYAVTPGVLPMGRQIDEKLGFGPGGYFNTPATPQSSGAKPTTAQNNTLTVNATINVPPGTPPESVGKELGRELARQVYNRQDYRGANPQFE